MYGPPEFGCLVAEPQKQIQCDHGKDGIVLLFSSLCTVLAVSKNTDG